MNSKRLNQTRGNEGGSQSLRITKSELKEMPRDALLEKNLQTCQPEKSLQVIAPDGGWGWVVAFAGSCNHCFAAVLVPTFSLIFSRFFAENDVSSTKAAWIFNINQCLWNASAFLGGPLCSRYGWRKVAVGGGLCISVSVILNGFVNRPELLFFTFSLFTGLGQGLCVVISFVTTANYFDKKKGIATGMVSAGNCLGQFLGPLFVRFLMENYGRQGTNLILGGVLLHTCVVSLLFHPVEWHLNNEKPRGKGRNEVKYSLEADDLHNTKCEMEKDGSINVDHSENMKTDLNHSRKLSMTKGSISTTSLDKISSVRERSSSFYLRIFPLTNSREPFQNKKAELRPNQNVGIISDILKNLLLLKWHRIQIVTLSVALAVSSYVNFLMMVPFAMAEMGHSLEIISWCLSLAGMCNFIARIVVTTLTDFVSFSTKYFFMMGSFGIFLSIIIFALVSSSQMILLTMCLFGMSVGTFMCSLPIICLELMGLKFLLPLLGLNGLLTAVFFLILGPLIGAVRDATNSYFITLLVLSIAPLLSFSLWFLMPCAISLDKRRNKFKSKKCVDEA